MDTNGHTILSEDYCSYEVAKLLKEKGFDGDGGDCECHMFYSSYSKMIMPITEIGLVSDFDEVYYAPTHQMAMKWLREVHGIAIEPMLLSNGWFCQIERILEDFCKEYIDETDSYKTYEESIEAAIKYCLENLL